MRGKYLRRLGGIILAALTMPGIVVLTSTTAEAQQRRIVIVRTYRPWRWDPFWRYDRLNRFRYDYYVFSNSEKAFDRGYKDGLKTGRGDAKNHRTYNPERSHYFQEAGFGNFGEVYRNGFTGGYADGFRS